MKFKTLTFSDQPSITVPQNLTLEYPQKTDLPQDTQHFLLNIPWNETYLQHVPQNYLWFFKKVLPHLHARTTDVHTAICCSLIDPLCDAIETETGQTLNRKVVTLSLFLHDAGWSQLTETEIAASLGVKGLALTPTALGPKEKHAVESVKIARDLLSAHQVELELSEDELSLILDAILHHDQPEKVASEAGTIPLEVQAMVDLDHQWSFMFENFWQDVYRKGINNPKTYLDNLENDLTNYFVTESGRALARKHLEERAQEVAEFQALHSA